MGSVTQRFDSIASIYGDRVALRTAQSSLTYHAMQDRSIALARGLMASGVGPGTRVAVLLDRTLDLPVMLLAILRTGAAYVPLEPNYPTERLATILAQADPALVVCDAHLATRLPPGRGFATIASLFNECVSMPLGLPACEHDPAYVMFTSGSTGQPKGVVVPHRGILRLVVDPNYVSLGADDVIAQLAPVAFDASTFEIWGALLNGGTLFMMPPCTPTIADVGRAIREHGITIAFFTTGLFHAIIDEQPSVLVPLRQVLAGGEAMSATHVRRLAQVAPKLRIINGYGPTETTTFAACYTVQTASAGEHVPIGKAINDTCLRVVDENLVAVPRGEVGQLLIGGAGVALGYLNDAERTAAAFVPDPADAGCGRFYRTGDLARELPDGNLVFVGRADQQIKIRGHRVEMGEVETQLRQHPNVLDAIVIGPANPERPTERMLAAFVILRRKQNEWKEALHHHLATYLPLAMLPAVWHAVGSFPLNQNGKVDRTELAQRCTQSRCDPDTTAPPVALNEPDALICRLCDGLLAVERIDPDMGFVQQGGNSLAAARLAARIENQCGVQLPLHRVLAASSLRELARSIEIVPLPGKEILLPPRSNTQRAEFPLSFPQQQLWLLHRADPASPAYNETVVITMTQAPDSQALERSLRELVRRHESLRTAYDLDSLGKPRQRVLEAVALPYETVFLRADEFAVTAERFANAPFDLRTGIVMRAMLAHLENGSARLLMVLHHICFDGVSLFSIVLPELHRLYEAHAAGAALPFPTPQHRYADFALWQREQDRLGRFETALDYWSRRLRNTLHASLPTRRAGAPGLAGEPVRFRIALSLVQQLRGLAREEGISLFAVFAAAFHVVLMRHLRRDEFSTGFAQDIRPNTGFNDVVGGFINTVVLHTQSRPGSSVREYLQQVWAALCEAQEHNVVPYERVAAAVGAQTGLRDTPLLEAMISYDPPLPALPGGWVASHLDVPRHAAKFPLALELGDDPDGTVYARFEFDKTRLSGATVARMQEHLLTVLEAMAAQPEGKLDRIEMLGRVEQRSIAQALQGPGAPRPRWTCVADILAHAAALHPDHPALVSGVHSLSYAELVRRATHIGSQLSTRMSGATTVALLFKDPFARCLAAWSAWMAGLTIVVLDPEYPSARLAACVGTLGDVRVFAETATAVCLPAYDALLLNTLESHATVAAGAMQPSAPGDAAYLVFTSGSTGTPKCIIVTQSNVCAMVTSCQQRLGTAEARRTLQTAGPSFDAYLFELLTVAADAGTLVLADRPSLLPGPELVDIMRQHEINDAFFTPSLLACLDPAAFPTLRSVTCAGEVCAPSLAAPWIAAGVRFVHAYGPAECTVCSTMAIIDHANRPFLPLGAPIPGYRVYLLDPDGNPVPLGAIGEICIAGPGVAAGYLGDATLTAAKFVADPWNRGGRMYLSGDLGRIDECGELEFIGREDTQLKVRGMRIDTVEIESALRACSGVQAAFVVAVNGDDERMRELGAYVVLHGGPTPAWRERIELALRERLPAHMLPYCLAAVETLPAGVNGKVARDRLPPFEGEDARTARCTADARAMTSSEQSVHRLWLELFPGMPSDPDVDFFDLGGHSLLAVQLLAKFNAAFNVQLPMRYFFERPTIAGMTAWLVDGVTTTDNLTPQADVQGDGIGRFNVRPGAIFKRPSTRRVVLLSGATGFVGSHVLRELLDTTQHDIWCLVRGRTHVERRERVDAALRAAGHRAASAAGRLRLLSVDLAAPRLGLDDTSHRLLADEVDAIYHCGAQVNSAFPYSALRQVNVEATRMLLELAAQRGAAFCHVSTLGIFEGSDTASGAVFSEDAFPSQPPDSRLGYAASKWAAESLVRIAAAQGLPVNTFRLGRAGWSPTGVWNENDFVCRLLRGCMEVGAFPRLEWSLRMIPVDFLVRAIVRLAEQESSGTWHLIGHSMLSWEALSEPLLREHGLNQREGHLEWWRRFHRLHAQGRATALAGLLEQIDPAIVGSAHAPEPAFGSARTDAALAQLGLFEPSLDPATLQISGNATWRLANV